MPTPMFDPQGKLRDVPDKDVDLALKSKGERAVLFHAPDGKKRYVRQSQMLDALQGGGFLANESDLAINPGKDKGEGTYKMVGPNGSIRPVAYSLVESASRLGFKMHDSDRLKYIRDAQNDENLKKVAVPKGVKVVGRNSAGQPMYGVDEPKADWSGSLQALGDTLVQAGKGVAALVNPKMTPQEEERYNKSGWAGKLYDDIMWPFERLAQPQIEQAKKSAESAKTGEASKAVGHGLAAVVPGAGPWAADVGEQLGQQIGEKKYGQAAGTLTGSAAVYEAPHAFGAALKAVPSVGRSAVEHFTNTTPREITDMAQEAADTNKAAAEKHLPQAAEAAHETRGKEIEYERQVGNEKTEGEVAKDLAAEHAQKTREVEEHNQRTHDKARKAHQEAVRQIQEHNARINEKHQANVDEINANNAEIDQKIQQRQADETRLEQETAAYYALEDQTKLQAKADADAAWQPWHNAMKDVTVPLSQIKEPLEKILSVSPEARREIAQLTPEPSEAAPQSAYAQAREDIVKQTYKNHTGTYWDLEPQQRATVDDIANRIGLTPDPIDLIPDGGQDIPVEQIQRARSILGRKIASGVYQGPLFGEMKQVYKILDQALVNASMDHGAYAFLDAGRAATKTYLDAFGRERNFPKTRGDIRKRLANPDQFKENVEEDNLIATVNKYSQPLADAFRRVRDLYQKLDKEPDVEKLEKQRKEVPEPPSVGDLRNTHNLKEEPVYEPPTVGDLRSGYALKEPPQIPEGGFQAEARRTVKQPERDLGPDRPKEAVIEPGDIEARKRKGVKATAEELRRMGVRRAMYATLTGIPFGIAMAFRDSAAQAALSGIVEGVAAGSAVWVGSTLLADLLEKPGVSEWIARVTAKDAQKWEQLPPEQKALFKVDMQTLVNTADALKKPVSPALRAFVGTQIGAQGAQQRQSLEELKKQADQNKPTPPPQAAAPGPQSSNYTHYFDPLTNKIIPVAS